MRLSTKVVAWYTIMWTLLGIVGGLLGGSINVIDFLVLGGGCLLLARKAFGWWILTVNEVITTVFFLILALVGWPWHSPIWLTWLGHRIILSKLGPVEHALFAVMAASSALILALLLIDVPWKWKTESTPIESPDNIAV